VTNSIKKMTQTAQPPEYIQLIYRL